MLSAAVEGPHAFGLLWGPLECPPRRAHKSWPLKLYGKEQVVGRGGERPGEVVQTVGQWSFQGFLKPTLPFVTKNNVNFNCFGKGLKIENNKVDIPFS